MQYAFTIAGTHRVRESGQIVVLFSWIRLYASGSTEEHERSSLFWVKRG